MGLPIGAIPTPNVATGLQALAMMGHLLPEQDVSQTLDKLRVSGRMQGWQYTDPDGNGLRVTLDVAHNPQAASYLSQRLNTVDGILLAMLEDKAPEEVLDALPAARRIIAAGLDCYRGLSACALSERLGQTMAEASEETVQAATVEEGIRYIQTLAKPGDHWLIVGSFFTVEAALNVIEADGSKWKSI